MRIRLPRLLGVTPAALADLVRSTAVDVLASRGLDSGVLPAEVTVERPRNPEHGDYATNLALQVSKKLGLQSRDFAGWLAEALTKQTGIAAAEVAGPGFLNLRLAPSVWQGVIAAILRDGDAFGRSDIGRGAKVNVEYV